MHVGFVLYIMYDMAQQRCDVCAIVEIPRLLIPMWAFCIKILQCASYEWRVYFAPGDPIKFGLLGPE